ncbi:hypothetical protein CG747_05235 [Streptomyces sp. CB02959]|uniref:DUF4190 domain-containing protein n=1 Tax=Streptomyces sp. CB02959 TaxID=2020330 RepID=UPI000C27FD41|nr:DUF4190 domain-containing protein [Streptomyces sp. CB02959]PJN42042.1 hypothetical protein CG747_05235 [Streptomyces sp. CB02959]
MTTPVSPDGPAPADPRSPDRDPWAPPTTEGAAQPASPYPPPVWVRPPGNGMPIAALVLGLVGIGLGLFVVLFWVSWLPAALAVVFGCVGLSQVHSGRATKKAMALSGVIMGVIGLLLAVATAVFTVVLVKGAVDEARKEVKEATDEASAKAKAAEDAAAAAEKARHLTFGRSYTFGNGLKVTVAKPEPFVPDAFANGHAKGNKAVEVTVTVVNTGSKRVSVETGLPDVNDADGASAELVIDGSGRQKVLTGYVLPGKEAVGRYAFSLPPDAADAMEVEFSPDAMRWEDAYWSGPTS